MGTNYYLKTKGYPHKKTTDEPLHIGKSSAGWYFLLKIYPPYINSLEDWKKLCLSNKFQIVDEYDEIRKWEELERVITQRKDPRLDTATSIEEYEKEVLDTQNSYGHTRYNSYDDMLKQNNAERGINGLWARRENNKNFKIIKTDGTYELTTEEFS